MTPEFTLANRRPIDIQVRDIALKHSDPNVHPTVLDTPRKRFDREMRGRSADGNLERRCLWLRSNTRVNGARSPNVRSVCCVGLWAASRTQVALGVAIESRPTAIHPLFRKAGPKQSSSQVRRHCKYIGRSDHSSPSRGRDFNLENPKRPAWSNRASQWDISRGVSGTFCVGSQGPTELPSLAARRYEWIGSFA